MAAKAQPAEAIVGNNDEVKLKRDAALEECQYDDMLLRRIAEHDESAFRELVERHMDRAYALALRILRNSADAEDVVQDVLLKVWTRRGTWEEGRGRFSTWLYRVVTNRCLDLRRRPRMDSDEEAPEQADESPDALQVIEQDEVTSLLDKAMQKLPDHQRIALILSYHDGMGNKEISEIMDTTVMAVESLLKRGRQQLRNHLSSAQSEIQDVFTKG